MINGQSVFEVKLCKFANFGEPSESWTAVNAHNVEYDELTIDARIPEFSFSLVNSAGVSRKQWRQSDVVRIYKNKRLVFTGSINKTEPKKSQSGQTYDISGIHYYYRVLLDNFTNASSELLDYAPNIWRFGRKKRDAAGAEEGEQLINGINPSTIIKALSGNKLVTQEFFDDMTGIDNVNWVKSADGFTDLTSSAGMTNPSFESVIAGEWVYCEKTRSGTGTDASPYTSVFSTGSINNFANVGRTLDNPKAGVASYKISFPASTAYAQEDGAGVYHDGIVLSPGDTIYASFKSVTSTAEITASSITARVYIFANGNFNNPNTAIANVPLLAGQQIGGTNATYIKVGGMPLLKQSGTYRVAFMFAWKGASATNGTTAQDLRIDDVHVIRGNQFTNVSLVDGLLQLKEIANASDLFVHTFDATSAGAYTLSGGGWTEIKPSGSITVTADSRFPSDTPAKNYVRLISAGNVTPTSMNRNLFLPYSDDWTLNFESRPAQTNRVVYPIVLTGKDKNGVTRTVKPLIYGADGKYYYNPTGSGSHTLLHASALYGITDFEKITIRYKASTGTYRIYSNGSSLGSFSYGSIQHTDAIVQFTNFGCAASDASQSATLDVNDYILTPSKQPKKYATSGTCQTKDYFVGRATLKKLPYFTGTTTLTVLAYPYYSDPANLTTVYKPQLKLFYSYHNYLTQVDTVINPGASFISPTSETVVAGDGLTEYVFNFDTSTLAQSGDKIRAEFTLTSDGNGTPKVDYFLLDANIENYNRQVSVVSNLQVYRAAITGISSDVSGIDDYIFPSDLLAPGTAPTIYNTMALEFLNTPFLRCIEELLGNTLKPTTLTSVDLPGLPPALALETQDSNWDFQIDHVGKITFAKNIGSYYGRYAGASKKEYSFRSKNLKAINTSEDGNEIINQLVYIGQGIAGINNVVTNPTLTISDEASINEFGLRVGRITEKRAFDAYGNVGRAYAILRQKRSPTVHVTVELLPKFSDIWTVGDIIYIRDLDSDIDDDFRVLSKSTKVSDDGGEIITVELSTKNKTIDTFRAELGQTLNSLNSANQGVSFTAVGGAVPKAISRDVPYILQVEIPADAEESLLRVLLDAHSEAISSNSTIVEQSGSHQHDITIPNLSIPSFNITIPALTFSASTTGTSSVVPVIIPNNTFNGFGGGGGNFTTSVGGFSVQHYNGFFNTVTGYSSFFMVFKITSNAAHNNFDWDFYSDAVSPNPLSTGSGMTTYNDKTYVWTVYVPPGAFSNSQFHFWLANNTLNSTITLTATLYGVPEHGHSLTGITTVQNSTVSGVQTATGTTQTNGAGAAGAHTHPTRFTITYNRDSAGRLLFPTNISVTLNDILGIGQVATVANSGVLPDLVGLGKHELGDEQAESQASGVGFRLQKYDVSHAFKDTNGAWIIGTHYLFFNAHGLENQVNQENVGVLQASVYYDVARRFNQDLTPPVGGPQL